MISWKGTLKPKKCKSGKLYIVVEEEAILKIQKHQKVRFGMMTLVAGAPVTE
jgi:hypothetical protein